MGLFDFFGSSDKKGTVKSKVQDIPWSKNPAGKYRRLAFTELEKENISGVSAIYVLWHGGVKPGWVYVGLSDDLAVDLTDACQNRDIMENDMRGGLFVTWATINPKAAPGIVAFLTDALQPDIINPDADMYRNKDHIKVLPPGYTQESFTKMFG